VRYRASEGFAIAHPEADVPRQGRIIVDGGAFTLETVLLDHGTPSVGYIVREAPRVNVDTDRLAALGLSPGPWLKQLREGEPDATVAVDGRAYSLAGLRQQLLVASAGDSIAYLTDFRVEASERELTAALRGVATVVCESQYRAADTHLARAVMHSTATEVAAIAKAAGVGRLILFHVSDRYDRAARREMLLEAQAVFADTAMPEGW
jgi:ribonuclease Z